MSKHLKKVLLISISVVIGFVTVSNIDNNSVASANPGSVKVNTLAIFGPAPININDTSARYMWAIGQIANSTGNHEDVTLSLSVEGVPLGCEQHLQLILPGHNPFTLTPYETKWILWRVPYTCQPPAYPAVLPLNVSFCASTISGSDCRSRSKNLLINPPAVEWSGAGSDVKTTWFTLCPEVGFCLPPWPIDWRAFSSYRVGFLGGSPNAIYLHWFQHGIGIWDYFDPDRPFDLVWNWQTWLSYIPFYGAGWREEEGMNQYTAEYVPGCNELWYPGRTLCSEGDVGYTYIDPQFHGYAGLWCEGPIGWDCVGSDRVDYYYSY